MRVYARLVSSVFASPSYSIFNASLTVLQTHAFYGHEGIVNAHKLYKLFRDTKAFSGSELNIEGATLLTVGAPGTGTRWIRFFQRGNGAPRDGLLPISATCDVRLDDLLAFIHAPQQRAPPALFNIVAYDLDRIGRNRLPLGFTDATELPPRAPSGLGGGATEGATGGSGSGSVTLRPAVLYLAGAEDSPDVFHDGPVAGSVVGVASCAHDASDFRATDCEVRFFEFIWF
jgi:hypothetical protein